MKVINDIVNANHNFYLKEYFPTIQAENDISMIHKMLIAK